MNNFTCSFDGFDTWSRIPREEHRSAVSQIAILSRIFEPKMVEVIGAGENCVMRGCTFQDNDIQDDAVVRECSMHEIDQKYKRNFGGK
jgi:hypothetical protein